MNQESFESIVRRYQEPVISIIYKMTGNRENAYDLAQDVFLRLWTKQIKIDRETNVFTYLYRAAMNAAIDYLRRTRPQRFDDVESYPFETGIMIPSNELYELIIKCAQSLKPKQRAVFLLRDVEGFDFAEIARILNRPVSNLRSNLHLARKNIRHLLRTRYQITEEQLYEV
ncbi:MAG: sigma-70 family RNA polymerase sigma factor [Caldithrix sp.]|nr:sigma-70 family RNA polymerase sigma factor [Caldithrix sp.]